MPMDSSLNDINLLGLEFLGLNISDIGTAALIIIMLTMGLGLSIRDFKQIYRQPKGVAIGLAGQLLILPATAFAIALIFSPPAPVAVGLIILACCPSGATSNFFSFLAKGDVALSIVLTTLSGFIVVFTIPLLVNLGLELFMGEGQQIRLPVLQSMLRIFLLVVAPVCAGMLINKLFPRASQAAKPYATKISFAAVLSVMAILLYFVWPKIPSLITTAGIPVFSLNAIMMILGFAAALLLNTGESQSRTISIEIGVQNYVLSVVIAVGLLKQPDFAIVPVIYLFTMYITVFSFISYCRYIRDKSNQPAAIDSTCV